MSDINRVGTTLSICVAIYNIKAEYLRACIESARVGLPAEAELILGDDGSKEETAKICREYADKDERIRYIRPERNGGVSYIRNIMTDEAKGKWLTFIDGDDAVANGYAAAICNALSSADKEYDIVMFKWQRFDGDVPRIEAKSENIKAVPHSAAGDFSRACLTGEPPHIEKYGMVDSTPSSVCIKAYRREFLNENNLRFTVGIRKSQDVDFNTRAFFVCKTLGYLPQTLYLYRKNPASVTNRYNPDIKKILYDSIGCDRHNLMELYQNDRGIERLWRRYKLLFYLINFFELDVFHRDNPKKYVERRQDFIGFIQEKPFGDFFITFDFLSYDWNERKLILMLAAKRKFGVLNFMYRHPITFKIYGKIKKIFGKRG